VEGACGSVSGNGWVNCTTASLTAGAGAMLWLPEAHSSRWPKVINNENGRRNFNDALSHNQ
jgi:hypothetical protein